jgi:NADPH:quinone reductase
MQTRDEFTWRTGEFFDSIAACTITVTVSKSLPPQDAAQAHRDRQGRKTVG